MNAEEKISLGMIIFFSILVFLPGCTGQNSEDVVIAARVGDRILTMDELNEYMVEFPDDLKSQARKKFVDSWVNEQLLLLYFEQQNLTLDRKELFLVKSYENQLKLEKLKKQLLDPNEITDLELKNYYENHLSEFQRTEDEYHFVLLQLESRNIGIEDDIRHSTSLLEVIQKNYLEKKLPGMHETNGDQGYVPVSRIAPQILNVMKRLKIGEISRAISLGKKICYVQVLDFQKAGTPYPFYMVRGQIKIIVYEMKLRERLNEILDQMKNKISIDRMMNYN